MLATVFTTFTTLTTSAGTAWRAGAGECFDFHDPFVKRDIVWQMELEFRRVVRS